MYEGNIPTSAYYAVHLFGWMLPVILLQWLGFRRILWQSHRAIFLTTLLVGSYLIATDVVAVAAGVWHFDQSMILAGSQAAASSTLLRFLLIPFGVPIEEWAFFYLTALLVAQSFVLFLPEHLRQNACPNTQQP